MRITALYYWCTNQAIIQRALGAKSLKEGQKGVLLTALLKIVVAPLILVVPGIIAYCIYGNEIGGDIVYPTLVNKLLPTYMTGFFGAVLFGAFEKMVHRIKGGKINGNSGSNLTCNCIFPDAGI